MGGIPLKVGTLERSSNISYADAGSLISRICQRSRQIFSNWYTYLKSYRETRLITCQLILNQLARLMPTILVTVP